MKDNEIYTVWVGGVEINDNLLTLREAQELAFSFVRDQYDDVVIDTYEEEEL